MIKIKELINNAWIYINKNALAIVVLTIFICFVMYNPCFKYFYKDELHAYCIAKQFGFIDIIRLMRAEGHTFLWYMLLKLIPNEDWCFPWALKWLSFSFSFITMILLWFKGPFTNVEKILITFTYPMISLYPVLGRPYSLSIMLLFTLAILYKKRLEHPFWFASLIFITANTSLMAAVGSFTFSIVFLYDLIKSKHKNLVPCILILTACLSVLYIQWHNPIIPQYFNSDFKLSDFLFSDYSHSIRLFSQNAKIVFPLFLCVSVLFFQYNNRNLFLYLTNILFLLLFFYFIYRGSEYHYYFIYIYLIISYWIQLEDKTLKKNKYKNAFIVYFIIINILFNVYYRKSCAFYYQPYYNYTRPIHLLNHFVPSGSTVYSSLNSLDYISKDKLHFKLKDYSGEDLFRFENSLNIYNYKVLNHDFEQLIKKAPQNSYILINNGEIKRYSSQQNTDLKTYFSQFKSYSLNDDLKLYKIK